MQRHIKITQIDAFTRKPFWGNPAAVVFDGKLNAEEMQLIAREMNLAETAFLSPSDKTDYNLKWFTPEIEIKLCGHATIASLHYLRQEGLIGDNGKIVFSTLSGKIKSGVENGRYFMQIPNYTFEEFKDHETKEDVLTSLSLFHSATDPDVPMYVCENGYLFIYVKHLKDLGKLKPDFTNLKYLTSSGKGFNSVVVYTMETVDENSSAHLRFFAPAFGINEDIVTGSANGPLLTLLNKINFVSDEEMSDHFIFEQGDSLNRPGRVTVYTTKDSGELYIAGDAVTVFNGELVY
ncbi:MAG: PhzF family phenazine biosynthesis protein [Ignavibacteriales bacterium]|nr:MAG: PhzF family phenazine biosynthesis protein [Ignavibacteriales bacterium]